jgi:antitoxin YefM
MFIDMDAVFHMDASELDEAFMEGLKQTFQHRRLEIVVRETDETEYLLRSHANRRALLSAMEDVEAGRNVVVSDQAAFQ